MNINARSNAHELSMTAAYKGTSTNRDCQLNGGTDISTFTRAPFHMVEAEEMIPAVVIKKYLKMSMA